MKVIDCNEAREFLKQHNEWRRGSVVEPLNPDVIGRSIDAVLAELDAYKAHVAELYNALSNLMADVGGTEKMCGHEFCCVCPDVMAKEALAKTPAQSLRTIQAKAVTDLISECSYSGAVDGIATSIIDVDSAISYADRLGEG